MERFADPRRTTTTTPLPSSHRSPWDSYMDFNFKFPNFHMRSSKIHLPKEVLFKRVLFSHITLHPLFKWKSCLSPKPSVILEILQSGENAGVPNREIFWNIGVEKPTNQWIIKPFSFQVVYAFLFHKNTGIGPKGLVSL